MSTTDPRDPLGLARDAPLLDETVPVASAPGRVCAELIAPYPPGVPVLPRERS